MAPKATIAFDLYGTLLSTSSVVRDLQKLLNIKPEKADEVAILWRRYQLEYSWRLNCMKLSPTFSEITLNSLHHALKDLSVSLPASSSALESFNTSILEAYDSLSIFDDAKEALSSISSSQDAEFHIFSNGTSSMLQNSVHKSPDMKPFSHVFKSIISVESTKHFKPAPEVYEYLVKSVAVDASSKVWLVSSNPFDVVGAKAVGIKTAWVDRGGRGWADQLMGGGEDVKPDLVVGGVAEAVKGILDQQ